MTSARAIEYRITRRLVRERDHGGARPGRRGAEQIITWAASCVVLAVLGAVAQELLWAVAAGAIVLTLGTGKA